MTHIISKSGFAVLICALIGVVLVGCGRKPSLSDLKPPAAKTESVTLAAPQDVQAQDGKTDGLVPVTQSKPQRRFILDFLL